MYLKVTGSKPIVLQKAILIAGPGPSFDIPTEGSGDGALFTLQKEETSYSVLPSGQRISVNGKVITRKTPLNDGDRLEWKNGTAVFLHAWLDDGPSEREAFGLKCLGVLETLANGFDGNVPVTDLLHLVLGELVILSDAEKGYLAAEWREEKRWELIASHGDNSALGRYEFLSNTVLNEAVKTRKPVYLESLVGHPWEHQASLMGARIFSICCLPLLVGDRVFGCVYLSTATTGRAIRKEGLKELQTLATQVALLLASAWDRQQVEVENLKLKGLRPSGPRLIVDKKGKMAQVWERIERLAPADLNLLVRGETGTGKELAAREIHEKSKRREGPFVPINCGSLPASLVESLLFGYAKGAFTGATRDTDGKFVEADGGTLFLDEIAELPLELQVKLLRVLQEKVIEPLGSSKKIKVDFRVVAATHQNLETRISEGKFREDLYYRLDGAAIELPPLRDRKEEIGPLAELFLGRVRPGMLLSKDALQKLIDYPWPGNIRELEQAMARAAALASSDEIVAGDLELAPLRKSSNTAQEQWDGIGLREAQNAFTETYVKKALDKCEGSRSRAAAYLGISERTLYRLLSDGTGATDTGV